MPVLDGLLERKLEVARHPQRRPLAGPPPAGDRRRADRIPLRRLRRVLSALARPAAALCAYFREPGFTLAQAQLPAYFAKLRRLLRPGGLLMNHGITAGGTRNHQLGAGIGDFIDRHIFPGGELQHVSRVTEAMSDSGLEPLDLENLRPHYARTLWAWSDALEARLDAARAVASDRVVRAYRLYLAGSAMGFERGWMALFQVLGARPSGRVENGPMRGAQSAYPFNRAGVYAASLP